jgi:hypothetical protein
VTDADPAPAHRATVARDGLPPAVARWVARAVPEGAPVPEGIELTEQGEILVGENWTPWSGTHLIWHDAVGFEWTARLRAAGPLPLRLSEGCSTEGAWAKGKLAKLMPLRRARGPEVVRAQLIRYLAELPLAPSSVLANAGLEWTADGPDAARVSATIGDFEATVRLEVDGDGDVIRASASDRPRETGKGGFEDTPFEIAFSEHAQVGEVRAPARAEHAYDYGSGPEAFLVIGVADAAPVES